MRIGLLLSVGLTLAMMQVRALAAEPTKDECIAASEEGQDLRRAGRIAAAAKRFATCSSESCPGPVRDDCEKRVREADRAQPTVRFVAKDSQGAAVRDVTVRIDGVVLTSSLDGTAIPVDAGAHQFEFLGHSSGKGAKSLDIVEGAKGREEIIVLEAGSSASSHGDGDDEGLAVAGASQKTLAYVSGGAGALLLIVGGVTGLMAKAKYDDAVGSCDQPLNGQRRCQNAGIKTGETASTLATVSTVTFIAGGVLAAGGIVLFATAPPRKTPAAISPTGGISVAVGAMSARIAGTW